MKVKVTKENVCITESVTVNENELNVNVCDFELPEHFQGLTITAMFNNIPVPLTGTQCYIPSLKSGTAILGVYAYKENESGELSLMYSPKPTCFFVNKGSYSEKINVEKIPALSEFERYCATVSALTFPKSDVVKEFDIEGSYTDTQVYSANAMNLVYAEIGEYIGEYDEKIQVLGDSAEKTSNKTTLVNELSDDTQYPSAAAVYKGLAEQSAKSEQIRTELAGEIDALSKRSIADKTALSETINGVNDRVTETQKTLDSVISEQGVINNCIVDLEENIVQLQEKTDDLQEDILDNRGEISLLGDVAGRLQSDLQEVHSSVNNIREMINVSVTDNANSIHGVREGLGLVEIDDISPLPHFLNVNVSGEGVAGTIIERKGKNMLDFNERTISSFELGNHVFTGKSIFLSIAGNGLYRQDSGMYSFDETTQCLTVGCERGWYGLGLDYKVSPNSKYIVSTDSISDGFAVVASFYDSDGNYISYISGVENKFFTTPANAEWMIVIFSGKTKDTTGEFLRPQLEKGDVATEYQPYATPQFATVDSVGEITGFTSLYPVTILSTDNPTVNITCVYNKDTDKAYKALVNAITALGGTV